VVEICVGILHKITEIYNRKKNCRVKPSSFHLTSQDKKNVDNNKRGRLLRVTSACSLPLSLVDRRDLTGTSQPMLGVLYFPLSPPSRKGATHYPDGTSSSQLASQGRATTPIRAGKSQLLTSKSVKSLIRQRNVTLTVDPPSSFSSLSFIEF
jgi:hypothetical protein